MNVNKVFLGGNLTRDIELKYTQSNMAVGSFGVAVNRKYKKQDGNQVEETTFVDCVAFGKTAEVMAQHLHKGRPVFVEGRLKLDQWEDKNTGQKRSKLSVVVDNFQFVGGRNDDGQQRGQQPQRGGGQADNYRPITDEDVPF
jgi:single-strand DNA-binding protein